MDGYLNFFKTHIKIHQLADGITLFVSSKTNITLAMNEIEIFRSFSGLILNRNKIFVSGSSKTAKTKLGVLTEQILLTH